MMTIEAKDKPATDAETGPIYGVELIDSLPLNPGSSGMRQAMPSRKDLIEVREHSERTVAGFEVLLHHWKAQKQALEETKAALGVTVAGRDVLRESYKGDRVAVDAIRKLTSEPDDTIAELLRNHYEIPYGDGIDEEWTEQLKGLCEATYGRGADQIFDMILMSDGDHPWNKLFESLFTLGATSVLNRIDDVLYAHNQDTKEREDAEVDSPAGQAMNECPVQ